MAQGMTSFTSPIPRATWDNNAYKGRIAYIRATKDATFPLQMQQTMIDGTGVEWIVKDIESAHSPQLSLICDTSNPSDTSDITAPRCCGTTMSAIEPAPMVNGATLQHPCKNRNPISSFIDDAKAQAIVKAMYLRCMSVRPCTRCLKRRFIEDVRPT